jgi:hypothetical protein
LGRETQDHVFVEVAMKSIDFNNWHNEVYGWQNELEIKGNLDKYHEMVSWINEHIPRLTQNVFWRWVYGLGPVFRFRKSKDKAWFMLRWS